MDKQYISNINNIDKDKVLILIDASLQVYNAFSEKDASRCQTQNITPPKGFDFIESWTGIDSVFNDDKTVECFGLVFRSQTAPYTYIFAFRGTSSFLDAIDDIGFEKKNFVPHQTSKPISSEVKVESGFFDIYTESSSVIASMQSQLFTLIDNYQNSDKPIAQLYITGHSLGSALSELFTLDLALSKPEIVASNYNYACPRVGNREFVKLYQQQAAQQNLETRTLRIQNTYDKVPCGPTELMGYQHVPHAFLIAFYEQSWSGVGEFNLLARHSSSNYQAVLQCAASSSTGVCINNKLEVPSNGYAVTSLPPNAKTICSFW